jgi:hypothetical protein
LFAAVLFASSFHVSLPILVARIKKEFFRDFAETQVLKILLVYFLHLLFADVLGQVKCQQTDDFLDFSIALPLPSLIFALTGLNLAYSNKQIFKLDPTTG